MLAFAGSDLLAFFASRAPPVSQEAEHFIFLFHVLVQVESGIEVAALGEVGLGLLAGALFEGDVAEVVEGGGQVGPGTTLF